MMLMKISPYSFPLKQCIAFWRVDYFGVLLKPIFRGFSLRKGNTDAWVNFFTGQRDDWRED
jgi:hypothetical protein